MPFFMYIMVDEPRWVQESASALFYSGLLCLIASAFWWVALKKKRRPPYPYSFYLMAGVGVGGVITGALGGGLPF
jgi:hypothetical protein